MPTSSYPLAPPPYFHWFRSLRIDRYILWEVIGPFLGSIIFLLFIFLMSQALRLADLFIIHGITGWTIMKMSLLLMLSFLPTALPIAFLVSVLIAFGRLSADSELIAMKASGLSIFRLSLSTLFLSLLVVGLSLVLNMEWVPWGQRMFKNMLIKLSNTKVVSSIQEGTFTSGFFDLLIFAEKVDSRTNQLQHVFVFDERESGTPLTVVASSGEILPVKTDSELGSAAMLKLYHGSIHRNDSQSNTYQKINFGEYHLYLKIEEGAANSILKPQMIPYAELVSLIKNTDLSTYEGREYRGEYSRRYGVAFAPLIFVFLGIGFGTIRTRSIRASAILITLVTVVIYWGIQTAASITVHRGQIPPYFAMQLPNIAISIGALFGFLRASW